MPSTSRSKAELHLPTRLAGNGWQVRRIDWRRAGLALAVLAVVRRCTAVLLALCAVAACGDDRDPLPEGLVCEDQRRWPSIRDRRVDLLIVVDRTASMADEQAKLDQFARDLIDELHVFDGTLPDLRIAVTSSDLGGAGVPGCSGFGDDGRLLEVARCGVDGGHLQARGLADGSALTNVEGDLAGALACAVALAPSTCPVSQPLAAAQRALAGTAAPNRAWRRSDAMLLVAAITDADDCSLRDVDVLAGITGADAAAVEAAVDHACFARGAACSPDDPTQVGPHLGCAPRGDRGLMLPTEPLAAMHQMFGVRFGLIRISGGGGDVDVTDGPRLGAACSGEHTAGPAPRLASIAGFDVALGAADVCGDWTDSLAFLAQVPIEPLAATCVQRPIEPAECSAEILVAREDGGHDSIALPRCVPGMAPGLPCYELADPEASGPCDASSLEVRFHRGDLDIIDVDVSLRCRVPCA
jgi:hypothetical protein